MENTAAYFAPRHGSFARQLCKLSRGKRESLISKIRGIEAQERLRKRYLIERAKLILALPDEHQQFFIDRVHHAERGAVLEMIDQLKKGSETHATR